jgi:hypothetical protein
MEKHNAIGARCKRELRGQRQKSLANDFDQDALSSATVKFPIENLLPRSEVEFAFGDGPSLLLVLDWSKCFSGETGIIQCGETARGEKPPQRPTFRSTRFERVPRSSKTRVIGRPWHEMANHEFQPGSPRHGKMGINARFSLNQFSEVFKVRNLGGQPYILVGGQAVNYWAERYFQTEQELKDLQPFTSEDIDFKGGKEDVKRIAEQLHLAPQYPPKVEMTALAGCIPFQIGDLKSNIEVVRTVPGTSGSVDTLAIEAELAGKKIRVLDPISLLACKLDLLITVSQEKRSGTYQDSDSVRPRFPPRVPGSGGARQTARQRLARRDQSSVEAHRFGSQSEGSDKI